MTVDIQTKAREKKPFPTSWVLILVLLLIDLQLLYIVCLVPAVE